MFPRSTQPDTARRRSGKAATLAALVAVTISACTATTDAGDPTGDSRSTVESGAPSSTDTNPPTLPTSPTASSTTAPVTTTVETTNPAPTTTTATTTTTTSTTTTTTLPEPLDVFDPNCVVRPEAAATMEQIATGLDVDVAAIDLWAENGFIHATQPGDLVDTCRNDINDIDGTPRPGLDDSTIARALTANVEQQQAKLNELFATLGTGDLDVDGVSGPRTGQRLCSARLALGFPTTIADMSPGSDEQAALLAASELPTPASTAIESERWVLIDRTCQIMFLGSGDATTFVFPTSTGSEGFETRDQDRADAFRFNPALDNGGWHNSSEFPVGVDNPLNGNLYKPLYFDLGQAIHGANNVPPTPQSKGCARLRVSDQETLIAWLGLEDAEGELWRKDEMNVTVNVQGSFVPRAP